MPEEDRANATAAMLEATSEDPEARRKRIEALIAIASGRLQAENGAPTRFFGREPKPDVLIVPNRGGEHRNPRRSLLRFHYDTSSALGFASAGSTTVAAPVPGDEGQEYEIQVAGKRSTEPRQHQVKVSMRNGHLAAEPARLEIAPGDVVTSSAVMLLIIASSCLYAAPIGRRVRCSKM